MLLFDLMRMSLIIFRISSSHQLVVYYVHFGRENQTNNNRVGLKTLNSWISALHHPTTSREQCNWTTCKVRQCFKYIPSYSPNSTTPTPTSSIQWDIIFAPTPTTYLPIQKDKQICFAVERIFSQLLFCGLEALPQPMG